MMEPLEPYVYDRKEGGEQEAGRHHPAEVLRWIVGAPLFRDIGPAEAAEILDAFDEQSFNRGHRITIEGMHFLYIRTRVSGSGGIVEHDVHTISSDRKLSIVPFQDVTKSTLLKEGEEFLLLP